MKKNYTHIVFLIDRSGSMISIKEDMEGGIKTFLSEQRKEKGDCTITVAQFDTVYEMLHRNKLLTEVEMININPRGGTALVDSMVKLIDQVGNDLKKMKESERPEKVLFIAVTDGQENASSEYKLEDLKRRIQTQEGTYNWQFVYLGANQDAFAEAGSMGISNLAGKSATYYASADSISNTFTALNSAVSRYRGSSAKEFAFTEAEKDSMTEKGK